MFDSQSSDERSSVNTVLARDLAQHPGHGVSYIDDDPSDAESYDVNSLGGGGADAVPVAPEIDPNCVYATPRRTSGDRDKVGDDEDDLGEREVEPDIERGRSTDFEHGDGSSLGNDTSNLYAEPGERSSLSGVLSCVYGLSLVVTAFVLTTAAYVGVRPSQMSTFPAVECFYIYLLALSLTCLMYVCMCMSSDILPVTNDNTQTIVENGVVDHYSVVKGIELNNGEGSILRQWTKKNCNSRSQCTSFYLRLAAAVLGIMSMVQASLEIGELFHMGVACMPIAEVVRSILHLTFTFVQLYTILLGAQTAIQGSVLPLFAYAHLIATNLSVLLRCCVVEILRDLKMRDDPIELTLDLSGTPTYDLNSTDDVPSASGCFSSDIIKRVVTLSSPYLFTYQMQYSLIVSGVLIAMWIRVNGYNCANQKRINHQRRSFMNRPLSTIEDTELECVTIPNYGLFLGLITLIGVVITTVVYFVLINDARYEYDEIASLLLSSVEMLLSVSTLVAMAIGAIVWPRCRGDDRGVVIHAFDDILLALSLGGILIFEGMNMVSLYNMELSYLKYFVFSSSVSISIQAIVQCVCIRVWLRQCSNNKSEHKSCQVIKQCIAYLLLVNLAFYVLTASIQQSRTETSDLGMAIRNFYGDLSISTITRLLTSNLSPLFRLSSVVCLAHLWNQMSSR